MYEVRATLNNHRVRRAVLPVLVSPRVGAYFQVLMPPAGPCGAHALNDLYAFRMSARRRGREPS